jgi:hypothetical protein
MVYDVNKIHTSDFAFSAGCRIVSQNSVDGFKQRISLASALVAEVVQIQGPDHSSANFHCFGNFRLFANHVDVVERDPLIATISVRSEFTFFVLDDVPSSVSNRLANLYNNLNQLKSLEEIIYYLF